MFLIQGPVFLYGGENTSTPLMVSFDKSNVECEGLEWEFAPIKHGSVKAAQLRI